MRSAFLKRREWNIWPAACRQASKYDCRAAAASINRNSDRQPRPHRSVPCAPMQRQMRFKIRYCNSHKRAQRQRHRAERAFYLCMPSIGRNIEAFRHSRSTLTMLPKLQLMHRLDAGVRPPSATALSDKHVSACCRGFAHNIFSPFSYPINRVALECVRLSFLSLRIFCGGSSFAARPFRPDCLLRN